MLGLGEPGQGGVADPLDRALLLRLAELVDEERGDSRRTGCETGVGALGPLLGTEGDDPVLHRPEGLRDDLGAALCVVPVGSEPGELLHHDPTCDVTAVVAAHAVGDHEDRWVGEVGVLVGLPDQPDVGGDSVVQLDPFHLTHGEGCSVVW